MFGRSQEKIPWVFSRSTGEITSICLPMYSLVTTSKSLLLLNPITGEAKKVHTGVGLYYGIALSPEHIYVAARGRSTASTVPRDQENGSILVFDHQMRQVDELRAPFALRDLHQILWHEGKLWLTCSMDNMIALLDQGQWSRWYPAPDGVVGEDINHFNSLYVSGHDLHVLAHNLQRPSEIWRFELGKRRLMETRVIGSGAHNIWMENGEYTVCSSHQGMLLRESGDAYFTGGFPRGVAISGELILVGLTMFAPRSMRDTTNGRILVLDSDWKYLHTLRLEGEGMVSDIRIPGTADMAHPHLPGVGIERSIEFPGVTFHRYHSRLRRRVSWKPRSWKTDFLRKAAHVLRPLCHRLGACW